MWQLTEAQHELHQRNMMRFDLEDSSSGPPVKYVFGPLSNNKVVQTKGQTSRAVAKAG